MNDNSDLEELYIGASIITEGFLNYIIDENHAQWICNNGWRIWKKNNLISERRGQNFAFLSAGTLMKHEIQFKRRSIRFFADKGCGYKPFRRYWIKYIPVAGYTNRELALLRKRSKVNKKKFKTIIKTYRLEECVFTRPLLSC